MKLLTIAVPCYNSEAYMRGCIDSLLPGGQDVEILIVNDGSTDGTAAIAEEYAARYPGIVRVVHKENGGHGSAVNTGIDEASGVFFKVVDSDDHLRRDAYLAVLSKLRELLGASPQLDMLLCNYVYDKAGEERRKVMHYRHFLPVDRMFTWSDVRRVPKAHYILMHSVIFRTKLLRECGIRLPEHCFYVDNLYVFIPLPYVSHIYYMDVKLYYYFIGREDQSVHQEVMIRRLDQQMKVNRLMFDYFADRETSALIGNRRSLRRYMYNYLEVITIVSSVLPAVSGKEEDLRKRDEMWEGFRGSSCSLYRRLRYGVLGFATNLRSRGGRAFTVEAYRLVNHFYHFN